MRGLKAIFIGLLVFVGLLVSYRFTRPSDEQLCLARAKILLGAIDIMQLNDGSIGSLTLIQEHPGDVAIRSFNENKERVVKDFLDCLLSRSNAKCPSGGCYKVIGFKLFCSKHGHYLDKETYLSPEKIKNGVVPGKDTVYWGNSYCIVDSGTEVSIYTRHFSWDLAPKAGGAIVHIIRNNDRVVLTMGEQSLDITDHPARDEMLAKIKYSFD